MSAHDPEVKGSALSCWVECERCPGGKLNRGNGAVIGSRRTMEKAARDHREETADAD